VDSKYENKSNFSSAKNFNIREKYDQKAILKIALPKIKEVCKDKINKMVSEKMIKEILKR